jgi:hypothetical protein
MRPGEIESIVAEYDDARRAKEHKDMFNMHALDRMSATDRVKTLAQHATIEGRFWKARVAYEHIISQIAEGAQ